MSSIIMTRGLPASGKSQWAKEMVAKAPKRYKRVSNDDLRTMLDNGAYSGKNEKFMLKARDALIGLALEQGFVPIVDATHLNPIHERHIREAFAVPVEVRDFTHVPLEECIARDRVRFPSVGEAVIRRMHREWLADQQPPVAHDPDLPDCVIVDLDGTLAIMGDRSPYDASRCHEVDRPNPAVRYALTCFQQGSGGVEVILLSGRDEKYRPQTEEWLDENWIYYDQLHMRAEGDTRKDYVVKRELYEAHVKGRYNVRVILDDRNQVVDEWRRLGLPCFQVAYGDF